MSLIVRSRTPLGGRSQPSAKRTSRSRARLAWLPAIVFVMAALFLAACGDDEKSSDTAAPPAATTPAADAPAGEPIKVMTVTTLEAQNAPTYKNIGFAAESYEKFINANGGIKGRPLDVTVCDDRGDPTQATACSRQAVKDGVVAVVGSFTFFGDAAVPVLEKADTAWFGICCSQSAAELTSKVVFPFAVTLTFGAGLVAKAVDDGCKSINAVVGAGALVVFDPILKNAAKAYGVKLGKIVTLPDKAQDYSPQVTEVLGNDADCVVAIFSESSWKAFMPAYQQAATKARLYGPQGNLNEVAIKGVEQAAEGAVIGGMYPDISTDPWADYRAALEANDAPDDLDFNSLGGLGTWAGYHGFKKVAESIEGEITAKSFLDAASATTALDLDGMLPKMDLTKEWTNGIPGFKRLFNCGLIFSKIEGGKVVPLTTDFQNASDAMKGAGKLGELGGDTQCS